MGLFSSSSSKSYVTTNTDDNRLAMEGDNSGVIIAPEAELHQTYEGNVGLSGAEISDIMGGLMDQQQKTESNYQQMNKSLMSSLHSQSTKFTDVIEGLKTDGASWFKYWPIIVFGGYVLYRWKAKK